jgi:hypothetical protein
VEHALAESFRKDGPKWLHGFYLKLATIWTIFGGSYDKKVDLYSTVFPTPASQRQ